MGSRDSFHTAVWEETFATPLPGFPLYFELDVTTRISGNGQQSAYI